MSIRREHQAALRAAVLTTRAEVRAALDRTPTQKRAAPAVSESGTGGHMASEVAMLRALAGSEHNTGTYTGCTQAPRSVLAVEKA